MKEFKIRKVESQGHRFTVEIEFADDGEREKFGFPAGEGWENEINGTPKFEMEIARRIAERTSNEAILQDKLVTLKSYEGHIVKQYNPTQQAPKLHQSSSKAAGGKTK